MKKFLVLSALLTFYLSGHSQNLQTDKIQWVSTGFYDSLAKVNVTVACQFVTNPSGGQVDWIQDNGNYVTSFTISAFTGSWPDLSVDGSVVYQLTASQVNGTLSIVRAGGTTSLKLILATPSGPISNIYQISSYTKQ